MIVYDEYNISRHLRHKHDVEAKPYYPLPTITDDEARALIGEKAFRIKIEGRQRLREKQGVPAAVAAGSMADPATALDQTNTKSGVTSLAISTQAIATPAPTQPNPIENQPNTVAITSDTNQYPMTPDVAEVRQLRPRLAKTKISALRG